MLTTLLSIAGAVLGAASMILHAIMAHTKTTVDDKAAVIVDELKDALPKA
jgi:hypothetical protein